MNSMKYLSALLLVLTIVNSQALNGRVGNAVDSALKAPARIAEGATNIVEEPVDTVFEEEEIIEEPQIYADEANDMDMDLVPEDEYSSEFSDDNNQDDNYAQYGYTDEDNIDSDYNAELE